METGNVAGNQFDIGIAVDLGSTTIAVSCYELKTQKELFSFSYANPQTAYGADVITRIKKCVEEKEMLVKLSMLVKSSLKEHLMEYFAKYDAKSPLHMRDIRKIVYSGNTAMLHILRKLPVNGLAAAPFTPVTLEFTGETLSLQESFFPEEENTMGSVGNFANQDKTGILAIYPPGFSAFVGADILIGSWVLQMGMQERYDLLVDLGTNGEMVLLNYEHGYATSTACGPVFDSAVTGAVYGSECIKAIAGCLKQGLIDKTGLIAGPYFKSGITIDKGFIIKQEHIRKFQLAKGAIYAGIICLMEKAGITEDKIGNVYISGGLGFYMNVRDAFTVKMLPEFLKGKITVSGNTSLEGAKKLLLADDKSLPAVKQRYEDMKKRTTSFELSTFSGFEKQFISAVDF